MSSQQPLWAPITLCPHSASQWAMVILLKSPGTRGIKIGKHQWHLSLSSTGQMTLIFKEKTTQQVSQTPGLEAEDRWRKLVETTEGSEDSGWALLQRWSPLVAELGVSSLWSIWDSTTLGPGCYVLSHNACESAASPPAHICEQVMCVCNGFSASMESRER